MSEGQVPVSGPPRGARRSGIGTFLLRRAVGAVIVLLGVSIVAFLMTALVPGSPAEVLLGSSASPERVRALTSELGLDKPLPVRFGYWLEHAIRGDFGDSILSHQPVINLLGSAMVATAELAVLALVISIVTAVPIGLLVGANGDRWWARLLMPVISVGLSIPGFLTGLLLILVFAVQLRWFPAGGYVPFTQDPGTNLRAMVLPTVSLAAWVAPGLVRFLRASTIGVLHEEYIAAARSRGVPTRALMLRHVAPNAAVSTITYIGLQIGLLIGGALVIEVVFAIPGMGRAGLNAILDRDYPVVQGVVVLLAAVYVIINLLVDVAYGLIDPRVRVQ